MSDVLADLEAVVRSLGGSARDGQIDLTEDVNEAMGTGGHLAAIAPTGTGKSLAYLVPAVRRAQIRQRTLISTDSLALQNQIEDDDAKAVLEVIDKRVDEDGQPDPVKVRTLKGFSNYVCQASLADLTQRFLEYHRPKLSQSAGEAADQLTGKLGDPLDDDELASLIGVLDDLAGEIGPAGIELDATPKTPLTLDDICAVLQWAWRAEADDSPRSSDVNLFPGQLDPALRQEITVSTDACAGESCPLFTYCAPRASRTEAGQADIVIVNHSLLGVQAAKAVPAAFGSKKVGNFHHVVIDEAHTLPAKVRDQGSESFGLYEARRIQSSITKLDVKPPELLEVSNIAPEMGRQAEAMAFEIVPKAKRNFEGDHEIGEDSEIDENGIKSIIAWLRQARALCSDVEVKALTSDTDKRRLRGLIGHLERCQSSLSAIISAETGVARWVKVFRIGSKMSAAFNMAPVDVSSMLRHQVYRQKIADTAEFDPRRVPGAVMCGSQTWETGPEVPESVMYEEAPIHFDSSVTCLSATLPQNFWLEAGMNCREELVYDSPFDRAYADSAAFSPRPSKDDAAAMTSNRWGKSKFDQKLHPEWAIGIMADLISANGGRALVATATAEAGRKYVQWLRQRLDGITVLSQWEGHSKDVLTEKFKVDETSVLVGTRGYMTGINVKGDALSLVIIDRIPRSPMNLIDEARAEALAEGLDLDDWTARERIYSADAQLLLEQAFGRLIRQIDDTGMVALLDPRIAKGTSLTMRSSRSGYAALLKKFGSVYSDPAKAVAWLKERRSA